jgi:Putative adhesin
MTSASAPLPMTPARRAILLIGVPLALAVIAVGVASWASGAITGLTRQVTYRVAVSAPATGDRANITVGNADITLGTNTSDRIQVHGTLRGSLVRPTFSWQSTAAGLALHSQCRVPAGICSLRYAITAPARLPVAVTDSSGDMSVNGFHGTVTLSDGSGDLGAAGLAGNVRLDDGSGDIAASRLAGGIQIDDGSGDISGSSLSGTVRFQDGSGDVVINGLAGTTVTGHDGSGDVTLTFTKVPARIQISDGSGDVTLVLPPGRTAYDVIASASSGDTAIAVPRNSSSKHVIMVTDQSGDITIAR